MSRVWWVIFFLAWVVVILPDNGFSFWQFNVLEVFASIAIVVAVVWKFITWWLRHWRATHVLELWFVEGHYGDHTGFKRTKKIEVSEPGKSTQNQ